MQVFCYYAYGYTWDCSLCCIFLCLHWQFYEDLVDGTVSNEKPKSIPEKPMNKKITFDSDSSGDEDEDHAGEKAMEDNAGEEVSNGNDVKNGETTPSEPQQEVQDASGSVSKDDGEQEDNADELNPKKPRVEDPPALEQTDQKGSPDKPKEPANKPKETSEKNIDDLIDEDLKELGDRKKVSLLFNCNHLFIICVAVLISVCIPLNMCKK